MSNFLYNFWLNSKPFRTMWIIPLVALTFLLIILYFFGNTDEMRCIWEARERWECTPESINES